MSKCLVFLPGIMGSELVNSTGKEVWPPGAMDLITGYDNIDELLDPNLTPTRSIRSMFFVYGVYKSLIKDFNKCGFFPDNDEKELIEFAYDWRLSNVITAEKLATRLDELPMEKEIICIGHSMGGLVLRNLLESGKFENREWFPWIKQLITLATPHKGAPEALRQVLGLEKKVSLSGQDIQTLTSDPRYPSSYQLTPDPTTAFTINSNNRGKLPTVIDTFADEVVNLPNANLSIENINSSKEFWQSLDVNNKPDGVDYFFFGGSNHKTFARNELSGNNINSPYRRNSGDGTVPITSTIFSNIPHGYSMKNHGGIFKDRELRKQLYYFLDAPIGVKPFSASDEDVGRPNRIGISLNKDSYIINELIELSISYTEQKTDPIESFSIAKVDIENSTDDLVEYIDREYKTFNIQFEGVGLLESTYVLDLGLDVGYYEIIANSEVDDPLPTFFTVVD